MHRPIGILGGTFDPVHYGHLRLALETLQICNLAEVRLIPLFLPSHPKKPACSSEHRMNMLNLALADNSELRPDEREIRRQQVSYTVDTLKSFREEFPQRSLCLIMGMDSFQSLPQWHQWEQLLVYAHIIVSRRPLVSNKIESDSLSRLYESSKTDTSDELHSSLCGKILMVDIPELQISSSHIRKVLSEGGSVRYLVPDEVCSYINNEDLYNKH